MDIKKFKAWAESKNLSTDGETGRNYSYTFYDPKTRAAWDAWQAAKVQAVPEGFILVPKEPTEAMIQRGTKANSECLNENAPLGERLFRHPALQVYQAMVSGSGE